YSLTYGQPALGAAVDLLIGLVPVPKTVANIILLALPGRTVKPDLGDGSGNSLLVVLKEARLPPMPPGNPEEIEADGHKQGKGKGQPPGILAGAVGAFQGLGNAGVQPCPQTQGHAY